MDAVLIRLKSLQRVKTKSINEFALEIGIPQVSMNSYFNGTRKLNLNVIVNVLQKYTDVSSEWLLRGEGDMLRTSNQPGITITMQKAEHGSAIGNNNTIDYSARTHELEDECAHLREENKQLRDRCDKLTDKLLSL